MVWYRAGTVSVNQNSSAVIGAGTAFISNVRVGDAFRGPDGSWYEVTNVASDTAMSITPNYQGTTNLSGSYALVPIQGYVKDSADTLRSLVNTYGAKLAALRTTGNFDVLPIANGGTGGNTQAGAQSALNLVRQTAVADKTINSLLVVGAFGRNGTSGMPQANTVDANNLSVQGRYTFASGGINIPSGAYHIEHDPHATPGYASQWAEGVSTNNLFHRTQVAGVWGQWQALAFGGENSNITELNGLTKPLTLAQGGTGNTTGTAAKLSAAAILGQVSQVGGVPVGSIIETGTNANGSYCKLADGTLICNGPIAAFAVGAGAVATVSPNGTFPHAYVDGNYFAMAFGAPNLTNDQYGFTSINNRATTAVNFLFRNGATAQSVINCRYLAIGRWF